MKRIIGLFFTVVFALGITSAQEKKAAPGSSFEVPFKMDRNLILIKGKLNQQEAADFIFDTGTQGVVLSTEQAQRNKLKTKGYTKLGSPNGEVAEKVQKVIVPSLDFNGLRLKNSLAVAVNPSNIFSPTAIGIIGLSAFDGYLVSIDYQQAKLIFRKGKLAATDKSLAIDVRNILEATVELNDKKVLAYFDCGAPGFIAVPMEWRKDLKLQSEPVLIGKGQTPGGTFEVYKAQLDGQIRIGALTIQNPNITLLTGGFDGINFGFEFFRQYRITIDAKHKVMEIDPEVKVG